MGDILTWLTGLATLVGFAVQLFGFFPSFAKQRNTIVLVLSGVFVGSSLRAFDSAKIMFDVTVSPGMLFVGIVVAVILLSLFAAAVTSSESRRFELYSIAGIALIPLAVASLAVGGSSIKSNQDREKEALSLSELSILSARAAEMGDIDRAVMHLETAKTRISGNEGQRKQVQQRIDELKNRTLEQLRGLPTPAK